MARLMNEYKEIIKFLTRT